ncbi:tetratricopeptide repeat domain containing protein [Theileria equi strain WA]|uniref:Tetratricopeptide repeat domain containing protein n=1 Tax=Theileria equi strain WA TaxID=1537102 RepID=L0AZ86_THEEQ|nr:tetratricopeptide repeat domain containing protein [Theileria equi strain WA]AFZ80568.1 tetratricopeptide repeat domain containing protein [Theileria equi strain WA]|eukprot:XP_004830234.1 tetratricopeptide repeat domain containing protein [Theileria equi strain WA]
MLESGFCVPLHGNKEVDAIKSNGSDNRCIWISQEDITPNNLEILKTIFKSEDVSLKYWLLLAFSYRELGNFESFDALLKDAETFCNLDSTDSPLHKGLISSALAINNLYQAEFFQHDEDRYARCVDWANHYTKKAETSSPYHFYLLKGQQYLMYGTGNAKSQERASAKSMFHMAISINPGSILPIILYANVSVMDSNFQGAMVFYMRALLICEYYTIVLERLKSPEFEHLLQNIPHYDIEFLFLQLKWLKALLFFSLAACQFALGDVEKAKVLIERSISAKPLPEAHRLRYAIFAWLLTHFSDEADTEYDPKTLLQNYTQSLSIAYFKDKTNPITQLQFSEFLFQRGKIAESEHILNDLKDNDLNYSLKAEIEYQLGRIAHVKEDYPTAISSYIKSIGFKSDFISPRLQLVKAASAAGDLTLAREHTDVLLQHFQKIPVVLLVSAFIYMEAARETLEHNRWEMLKLEGTNKNMHNLDTSCLFHGVQQGVSRLVDERLFKALGLLEDVISENKHPHILECYIRCLEILVSRGRESMCTKLRESYLLIKDSLPQSNLSFESRNNYGVMALYSKDYSEAISSFTHLLEDVEKCIECHSGSSQHSLDYFHYTTISITVRYNLGLALEFSGNIAKAQRIYSQLTRDYPKYASPWIRRSNISFKKGDLEGANRYLEQLKKVNPGNMEPWLHRAHQLADMNMYDESIQELRRLFRVLPSSAYDPYANTLMSSIMIQRSYLLANSAGGVTVSFPKEAIHYAKLSLRRPALCNFYAANVIAVILAHEKHLKPAYESFGLLLESVLMTPHMKFIANKNMAVLSAAIALSVFINDRKIDRTKFNKVRVAKAQQHFVTALSNGKMDKGIYFTYARFLFDVQKFDECISLLETARLIFPDEIRFLHNQAIAVDGMLCSYLRDSEKTSSVHEMSKMASAAKFVVSAVEHLTSGGKDSESPITTEAQSKLKQVLNRVRSKVIPHISTTLPQLEKTCESRQKTREKRLQLQLTIQQAQEAKKRKQEEERLLAAQAEEALSQQLLKEASEIASELLLSKPPT